ncbi:hypothetical protein WL48_22190 [Burkholderia ubonensis]|uniref:transposase n=1 Tax=Burkholderia ubonensis TaxID=101571 RepID=UPI0007521EC4|nr:transposase [Burkholderia ubonensis]KWC31283.1 hypothetical protein WL48_22190 [Burkholderia ubonensis]KWC34873.1 hypothetical protein WL49_22380 [Burkholderia ubonensis]
MDEMSAVKRVKSSKRPNFADEFKRALVEQTFEPDASVSLIARCNESDMQNVVEPSPARDGQESDALRTPRMNIDLI